MITHGTIHGISFKQVRRLKHAFASQDRHPALLCCRVRDIIRLVRRGLALNRGMERGPRRSAVRPAEDDLWSSTSPLSMGKDQGLSDVTKVPRGNGRRSLTGKVLTGGRTASPQTAEQSRSGAISSKRMLWVMAQCEEMEVSND
jgi:hypothetical protein